MPVYAYKGIGSNGKSVDGVRDAESPKGLRQVLRKDGVVVVDFHERKAKGGAVGSGKGLRKQIHFGQLTSSVKRGEIVAFTGQLATLLKAGIPLAEALSALFEQTSGVKLKSILGEVRTAVNEGASFADALQKHEEVFEDLYISMVRAGETAGNLDEVLYQLGEFLESSERLKGKVTGAMIYPLFMMAVGFGVLLFLMITVIPEISRIFEKQKMEMPLKTQLLIWSSGFFMTYWYVVIALVGLSAWGFRAWTKSPDGRKKWDGFKLNAPLYGAVQRNVAVARFCRTVGAMLQSGVPMLRTLDIAKQVLGNSLLVGAVEDARKAVTEGESLATTLDNTGHFPPTVIHMVSVGERAGALETMLLRVADAFDREVELKLNRFTAILGPGLILFMALGVFFMVFAILEPLLEMQEFAY